MERMDFCIIAEIRIITILPAMPGNFLNKRIHISLFAQK
jgi:hypothetical protein